MSWGIFKLYDYIKGLRAPIWLKKLLQEIQDILIALAIQVGKDYITNLQNKIVEVSQINVSNQEKFKMVFRYGKDLLPTIKDSYLNLLIEVIFSRLKGSRVV